MSIIKQTHTNSQTTPSQKSTFAFEKINYIIMLGGLALLGLGYIFLIGGGAEHSDEFSYDLFDFQRLVLAPILMVLGLVAQVVAIMYKSKKK